MITMKENDPCIWAAVNPLNPKIGGHILSTSNGTDEENLFNNQEPLWWVIISS